VQKFGIFFSPLKIGRVLAIHNKPAKVEPKQHHPSSSILWLPPQRRIIIIIIIIVIQKPKKTKKQFPHNPGGSWKCSVAGANK